MFRTSLLSLLTLTSYSWAETSADTLPPTQQGWASVTASGTASWSSVTCDFGQKYVTSNISGTAFGRCCDNIFSNCGFGTRCDRDKIYYHPTGYSSCQTGQTCNVMSIYEYATTEPPVVDIFCWDNWEASAIFRYTTTEATQTISSDSALATGTMATPGASRTTSISPATASPTTVIEKQESKSWIAGAVVGPIAGCVAVGALWLWLARRIRKKKLRSGQDAQHKASSYRGPFAHQTVNVAEIGPSSPNGLPHGTGLSELESNHYRRN